jgi:hypothetical protein
MLVIIKELFWQSVKFNFKLSASYLPGKLNILSDRISGLHEFGCAVDANVLLKEVNSDLVYCKGHMSQNAYFSLQSSWHQHWYC